MLDEARRPPRYNPHAIKQTKAYCLECVFEGADNRYLESHLSQSHPGIDPKAGVSWTWGGHLLVLLFRRDEWEKLVTARFHNHVLSLRGADDFLHETDLPPPPKMIEYEDDV